MNHTSNSKKFFQRLFLLAAAVAVGGLCWYMLGNTENVIADETAAGKVLAKVDGQPITEDEVAEAASAALRKVERERHQILEDTVRTQVQEKLLDLAAEKRGVSREELIEAEVNSKVAEVTDADVDAFFEERKAQMGNRTKEQVAPQIRQYLAQVRPQEAMQTFLAQLEESHDVVYMMEPYRIEVAAEGPSKGPDGAPVTIVEFSDFECPFCGRVNPTLKQVRDNYGDKVQIVFRQFPLQMHPNAPKAAEASLCARDQQKFWEMHDAMFADQRNLAVDKLKEKAAAIEGLDAEKFDSCLDSGKYSEQVDADMAAGAEAGVSGTPAFFINGRFINGAASYEAFAEIIDDELKRKGS